MVRVVRVMSFFVYIFPKNLELADGKISRTCRIWNVKKRQAMFD